MHRVLSSSDYSVAHDISHVTSENFLIHSHPFYELYYYIQGDMRFIYDGTEYQPEPETLIIIVPDVFHGIRILSSEPYERYTVHFTDDAISPEKRKLLMAHLPTAQTLDVRGSAFPHIIPNAQRLGLRPWLEEFDHLCAIPREMQSVGVSTVIESILLRLMLNAKTLIRQDDQLPSRTGARDADEVLSFINDNITRKLTLDSVANHFFVSKSRLNALFRGETGYTVMEYISVCRLKYAQQLLLNGFSAVEACQASGFGDYTAFYRAYVKYFKHQPKLDKREPVVKQAAPSQNPAPWFKVFRSFYDIYKDEQPPAEANIWDRNKTVNMTKQDPSILRDS